MAKEKRPRDPNQLAKFIADVATKQIDPLPKPEAGKNPNAVELGRMGGLKGGKARAEKLTPEQRQDIAKKAAKKRWNNKIAASVSETQQPEGIPMGTYTWDEYVDVVGDTFHDAKTADIIKYISKANPKLPMERITDAVRTSLTKKVKEGKLPYTAGKTKKAGYTYHFKDRVKLKAA